MVDWFAGGEEEEFAEPKAISAAFSRIVDAVVPFESAFTSTIIPMPSSGAATISDDTPGAPPSCKRIF
jgi:hypothetical protein